MCRLPIENGPGLVWANTVLGAVPMVCGWLHSSVCACFLAVYSAQCLGGEPLVCLLEQLGWQLNSWKVSEVSIGWKGFCMSSLTGKSCHAAQHWYIEHRGHIYSTTEIIHCYAPQVLHGILWLSLRVCVAWRNWILWEVFSSLTRKTHCAINISILMFATVVFTLLSCSPHCGVLQVPVTVTDEELLHCFDSKWALHMPPVKHEPKQQDS